MAKKSIEKMVSDIVLIRPEKDAEGKYYSACTFSRHIGIIGNNQYKKCQKRGCPHYIKLREFNYRSKND